MHTHTQTHTHTHTHTHTQARTSTHAPTIARRSSNRSRARGARAHLRICEISERARAHVKNMRVHAHAHPRTHARTHARTPRNGRTACRALPCPPAGGRPDDRAAPCSRVGKDVLSDQSRPASRARPRRAQRRPLGAVCQRRALCVRAADAGGRGRGLGPVTKDGNLHCSRLPAEAESESCRGAPRMRRMAGRQLGCDAGS